MSAIGPSDWVECVDASAGRFVGPGLTLGAIYCVDQIDQLPGWTEACCSLVGMNGSEVYFFYRVSRFRPIYRPNSDFINSLKAPAPPAVRELVAAD